MPLADVIRELEHAIVQAAQNLRDMEAAAGAAVSAQEASGEHSSRSPCVARPAASGKHTLTTCLASNAQQEDSAEQPENRHGKGCRLPHIVTLDDCKSWYDAVLAAPDPVKRISEAIAVLQAPLQ